MPIFKHLDDTLSVGGQIDMADLRELAEAGFNAIIVNRPDGEEVGQPSFAAIAHAASEWGMAARYVPMESGKVGAGDAAALAEALDASNAPAFAYCRTGTRSTQAWALVQKDRGMDVDEIIRRAAQAGYDVASLVKS